MPEDQDNAHATPSESESSGSFNATATAPVRKPAPTKHKPRKLPPYRVLLHNDDVNTFEHVIQAILKLTTLTPQEAMLRTLEAHDSGLCLLLTTHKERAELYAEQFASLTLTVTIEPDGS